MTLLERYAYKGHCRVRGWLSSDAIALIRTVAEIQRRFDVRGPIGEIGVHHGKLFILLHLLTKDDERSVAWDLFDLQEENIDRSGKGDCEIFTQNLRRHGCDMNRISIVRENSMHINSEKVFDALGGGARLFSVDGGHTAEITFHDLQTVSGALCDGGIIILDDVFNDQWPGVADGTIQFLIERPGCLFPIAIGGNKMLFTGSKEYAERYITALSHAELAPFKIAKFRGEPVLVFSFPKGFVRCLAASRFWRTRMRHLFIGRIASKIYSLWKRF